MKKETSKSQLIKVQFFVPVNGETDYYFGSLAAIYEQFTDEQIGCKLESLWNAQIEQGKPKSTRNCVIFKHEMVRKKQTK